MRTKLLLSLLALLVARARPRPRRPRSSIRVGVADQSPAMFDSPALPAAEDQAHALLRAGRRHAGRRRAREGDARSSTAARAAGVSTLLHISTTDLRDKRGPVVSTTTYRRNVGRIVALLPQARREGLRRLERGQPQDAGDVEPRRQRRLVLQEHVPARCTRAARRARSSASTCSTRPASDRYIRSLLRAPEPDLAQAPEGRRHPQLLRRQPQPLDAAPKKIINTVAPLQQAHEVLVHRDRRAGELRQRRSRYSESRQASRMQQHVHVRQPLPHAGRRARLLLQLVRHRERHGCGRRCLFDAGLVDPDGTPRPVSRVFKARLRDFSR